MTLCPIALMIGCKKCPVFALCPVKSLIGDYTQTKHERKKSPDDEKESSVKDK